MATAAGLTPTSDARATSSRTGSGLQATEVSGHDGARSPVVISAVKTPQVRRWVGLGSFPGPVRVVGSGGRVVCRKESYAAGSEL